MYGKRFFSTVRELSDDMISSGPDTRKNVKKNVKKMKNVKMRKCENAKM